MPQNLIAKAAITIAAPRFEVWDALVNPAAIKQYMFGTNVTSDWTEGSSIAWRGEWQGRQYEDKGVILRNEPERLLRYTHFSPLSGQADLAENYHTVTIELLDAGADTRVVLTQDNNATDEERAHSEKNWTTMLDALKRYVEGG